MNISQFMGCVVQKQASRSHSEFQQKATIRTVPNSRKVDPQPNKILTITNKHSRYRLKYGQQYKNDLEPRDKVMEHQFQFTFMLDTVKLQETNEKLFTKHGLYLELKNKIKGFLVQSVSNVVSAGFKLLCQKQLQSKEAKELTAKNIMINLHAVFRETIHTISNDEILSKKVDVSALQDDLILEMDNMLNNILLNLADNFPQAPPSGGTPRMRDVIIGINRVDDEKNDFLFVNGLKISEQVQLKQNIKIEGSDYRPIKFSQNGDYTSYIMKVLNKIIEITESNKQDSRQRTVYEKFVQFSQRLFWLTQQKDYQNITKKITNHQKKYNNSQQFCSQKQKGESKLDQSQQNKMTRQTLCGHFKDILQNQEDPLSILVQKLLRTDTLNALFEKAGDGSQIFKRQNLYKLGQKVPSSVKPFTREEIANKEFSSRHSSVLRILTKWAQHLQQIFINPQKYIKGRQYSFKNIDNQLCEIDSDKYIKQGSDKIIQQLKDQYKEVKLKFKEINKASYRCIGRILNSKEGQSIISSVERFNQTRIATSKINAILTSLMLKYTNILIDHLLRAGQTIWTNKYWQSINLITFKIGDLMRSKLQCNQNSFIAVLQTMYMLDESKQLEKIFKLVRIKNKLDDPANNIIINYVFMNRIQCQLQLSIQEPSGKQKHYYSMSHFIYELIRGRLGPIVQCATMISQLDPMVSACQKNYYQEKQYILSLIDKKQNQRESLEKINNRQSAQEQVDNVVSRAATDMFYCDICTNLILDQNTNFHGSQYSKVCFECIAKHDNPEKCMSISLRQILQKYSDKRMKDYKPLKYIKNHNYFIKLKESGELEFYVAIYIIKYYKTFILKINEDLLKNIRKPNFSVNNYIYYELSSLIKKHKKKLNSKIIGYSFQSLENVSKDLLNLLNLNKVILDKQLQFCISSFTQFQNEQSLVTKIKYKHEIIDASGQSGKLLNKIVQNHVFVQKSDNQDHEKLRSTNFIRIKQLKMDEAELEQLSKWISTLCPNIQKLSLNKNKIKSVKKEQLPYSLKILSIAGNGLQQIDISRLPNLQWVQLVENNLTSFKVEKNDALIYLHVWSNKLKQLYFGDNNSIRDLSISSNPYLKDVQDLPSSLVTLDCDRQAIVNYDFGKLDKLQQLQIYNGQTERHELRNLRQQVDFQYFPNEYENQ